MTTKTTSNHASGAVGAATASAVTIAAGDESGNGNDTKPSEMFICSICCYEKIMPGNLITISQRCQHNACEDCIVQWIEKEESSGQDTPPTCPFCRLKLNDKEVLNILGRSFQPKRAISTGMQTLAFATGVAELDDLTFQWLQSQSRACPSCGAYIEKIDDGSCDLMECLCGYRFCYKCGRQGGNCRCSPATHGFWDNILDRHSPRRVAPLRASRDDETGVVDLKSHIEQRKKKQRDEQLRLDRALYHKKLKSQYHGFETSDDVERDIVNGTWLFCSKTNSIRVLQQMRGYKKRYIEKIEASYERGIHRLDYRLIRYCAQRNIRKESMVPPPHICYGWWLFGVKSEKTAFRMLSEQASAIHIRQQRARNKEQKWREVRTYDVSWSWRSWMYGIFNPRAVPRTH